MSKSTIMAEYSDDFPDIDYTRVNGLKPIKKKDYFLQEYKKRNKESMSTIRTLESEVKLLRQQLRASQREQEMLSDIIQRYREELKEYKSHNKHLRKEVEAKDAHINNLNNSIEEISSSMVIIKNDMSEAMSGMAGKIDSWKEDTISVFSGELPKIISSYASPPHSPGIQRAPPRYEEPPRYKENALEEGEFTPDHTEVLDLLFSKNLRPLPGQGVRVTDLRVLYNNYVDTFHFPPSTAIKNATIFRKLLEASGYKVVKAKNVMILKDYTIV